MLLAADGLQADKTLVKAIGIDGRIPNDQT